MPRNVKSVALVDNLTRDPELRDAGSTKVASPRLAVNDRVKHGDEWTDVPYYLDVSVFGDQAEACAYYLSRAATWPCKGACGRRSGRRTATSGRPSKSWLTSCSSRAASPTSRRSLLRPTTGTSSCKSMVALCKKLALAALISLSLPSAGLAAAPDTTHTLADEDLDAVASSTPVKTRFEGKHSGSSAVPYVIDADMVQMAGSGGGFLVFREVDSENFYEVDFRSTSTSFRRKLAGSHSDVASVSHGFGAVGHVYRIRLTMAGATFNVYDRDQSLTTPILSWTDPENRYPVGRNVSYYAQPGGNFCWEHVVAAPQGQAPFLDAESLLGGQGYLVPQVKNTRPVNIGNSRYPLTFGNYVVPSDDRSLPWDMLELGQSGNMDYSFASTADGAAMAYRAGTRDTTGKPRSGYEARVSSSAVQWGRVDGSGKFVQLASGPGVAPGTMVHVVVNGSIHHLEANGARLTPDKTDSTYDGVRAYIGHYTGSGTIHGAVEPKR
jgi:hypothetical protein